MNHPQQPPFEPVVLRERGANDATSDRRLFVQFYAATTRPGAESPTSVALTPALRDQRIDAVLYEDARDPRGFGVAFASEDPHQIIEAARTLFVQPAWIALEILPDYTMLGRSYSLGYETDIEDTLIHRPLRHLLDPDWPWAIWYPLRRSGAFETLPQDQKRKILGEHARIGMDWGRSGLARDIRLACHGLGGADNDFVIGLFGRDLFPLSALIARMRSTEQTSQYLEQLGPFFAGRAVWRSTNT
ncbi:chlorite dismutase family protein [Mucisphaera calidilacus]|uniref:Putative heme peroxidase n=1 Tax=Mucisphaera calidilacus TaxID=2527982 RepID=A0A518C0C6_9BACT|nr:chlorite dismutase family protein [Mucisphaera calidilacus]QDU72678.1 putative heme peroxidase [Mucisphaera calidilacus]